MCPAAVDMKLNNNIPIGIGIKKYMVINLLEYLNQVGRVIYFKAFGG